jgi:DNA-binding LacI/PurR family transcriptional regulator
LWLHRLAAAGIPVVAYGDSPDLADFDRVLPDHEGGTYDLTTWLISQGRKRIVNLTGNANDYYWYHNRVRGYERAMRDAGLPPLSPELFTSLDSVLPPLHGPLLTPWVKFDIERHQLAGHLAPLLTGSEPVDAIMLVNDGQVSVAAAALRLLGKEPGRDVLLVGYDNIWADCPERQWESAGPAATVDKCNSQIGQELVRLLVERVEGKLPIGPQRRIVPSRLVVL